MKRYSWIPVTLAVLALLAVAACAPKEEKLKAGNLKIKCASLSTAADCAPGASGMQTQATVVDGGTIVRSPDTILYAAALAANTGEEPVLFYPVFGMNMILSTSTCEGTVEWCWYRPIESYELGPGEFPFRLGYGDSRAWPLGAHQLWTLALNPDVVGYLGSQLNIVGGTFDPNDPGLQPYILDWARVDFTVVAP